MIEIDEFTDLGRKSAAPWSSELHLYRARIYDNCGEKDNRLQVRIIPYMNNIPDDESDNLPKYPSYFKGEVVRGFTEKNPNPDTGAADVVMVAANVDFTFGYVLGLANNFEGCADETVQAYWNYMGAKNQMTRFRTDAGGAVDYNDIYVDLTNSSNTYIEFHSVSSGAKWMLDCFGDMIYLGPHTIVLTASSGSDMKTSKAFSQMRMTANKIEFFSDLIDFKGCDKVILTGRGHQVVTTVQKSSVSCDGMELSPATNVYC